MAQSRGLLRTVIAESAKHYGQSAHSHFQTKRPAGATNERIPKSLYIKGSFIKTPQRVLCSKNNRKTHTRIGSGATTFVLRIVDVEYSCVMNKDIFFLYFTLKGQKVAVFVIKARHRLNCGLIFKLYLCL